MFTMARGKVSQAVLDEVDDTVVNEDGEELIGVAAIKAREKKNAKRIIHEIAAKHGIKGKKAPVDDEETDPKDARARMREKLSGLKGGKVKAVAGTKTNDLQKKDEEYRAKYKHYIPGSLKKVDGETKLRAMIQCTVCPAKREVYTSDLFQVKKCEACTKAARKKTEPTKPTKATKSKVVAKKQTKKRK